MNQLSIKALYPLALAEGEGVGTAYEYFAKRLALRRALGRRSWPRPCALLIAGLPQKYGSSLDFFLLASELGAELTIIDDRPEAIAKAQQALVMAQKEGLLTAVEPHWHTTTNLSQLDGLQPHFDLVLSSEVLQRLTPSQRHTFINRLATLAQTGAFFAPNADNDAHVGRSGLGGLILTEMSELLPTPIQPIAYIDMPPFPPGIVRSEEQREQATTGRMEALAMWGLMYYARLEKFFPTSLRRAHAHIVYGITDFGI